MFVSIFVNVKFWNKLFVNNKKERFFPSVEKGVLFCVFFDDYI